MVAKSSAQPRRGAAVVELAVIAPVFFLLIFGLIICGLGIFRYQQVASLAREGARYAAVRGTEYAQDTHLPAATQQSVLDNAILPKAVGLNPSRLSCAVSWDLNNAPKHEAADESQVTNIVTVTVTYQWIPEAFFGGINLQSTSRMPMSH